MKPRNQVREVIRKGFPEYRNRLLLVIRHRRPRKDYYAALVSFYPFILFFWEPELSEMPEPARRGIIAHEVAHLREDSERGADLMAVERGFRDDLIAFHRWHNKRYQKYKKGEGVTLKELKKM